MSGLSRSWSPDQRNARPANQYTIHPSLGRLLAVLLFLPFIAAADDSSIWTLQFYGEAPCYGASGKQVFTLTSSAIMSHYAIPGYTDADYFRDIVSQGGQLGLTDDVGRSTFDITGCGADPIHSTEQATFAFQVNPGGAGIYYVQTNNYVNYNFCGSNTINVTFDPVKLQIQGNYVDTAGSTRCAVAVAAPGASLPVINPSQPPDQGNPDCSPSATTCPLQLPVPFPLKDAAERKFYQVVLGAVGGTKPYTYAVLPADPPFPVDIPKGISYSPIGDQFVISGTPLGNYPDDYIFGGDSFDFRLKVTDAMGQSVTELVTYRVVPPLNIHPTWRPILLSVATEGAPYFDYVTAYGGDDLTYAKHWSLAGGALPPGIKMTGTSGMDLIFGGRPSPGSRGTYTFQVKVDDGFSYPDLQTVVINVFSARTQPLRVTTSTLPAATQGDTVGDQLGATGGAGTYTWTLSSTAPPGLSLSAQGVLSGRAKQGADAAYSFSVHVKDSDGKTAGGAITMRVNPPPGSPLHFNRTAPLPQAYAGSAFTASVQPLGGMPPYAISLDPSSPPLPSGLKLSPQGTLSGTPAKAQSVNLVFSVKDSKGKTSKATLRLDISGSKPPALASLSPESLPVNSAAFHLQVKGMGFAAGASLRWNDQELQTSGNGSELTALVPADLLTTAGTAQISVENSSTVRLDPLPFAVLTTQPSTLTQPLAGANLPDTVRFEWIRSTSSQYRLQIGDHGVATNNLFDKTLPATAASVTASGLPLDGRSLYVRLGSQMHNGWHYQDYVFSTVRSPTVSRAQVTVTLVFNNSLLYPVDITVNGTLLGAVKASSTAQQAVTVTPPLLVSVEMERPRTTSGVFVGDEFKGHYSPITSPVAIENFIIDNHIGSQEYFIPIFNNTTSQDRLLGVNMGLQAENRCNCIIPAHGSNVAAGYYQLFTNSNVRLYDPANQYSGGYIYWGSPDGSATNSLVPFVEQKTGRLSLTIK